VSVLTRGRALLILGLIVAAFAASAALAMRHTSTTFDEILFPAAGARGFQTGAFDLVIDHPRLLQYVYGAPLAFMGLRYPDESVRAWEYLDRYDYARAFYFESGNDPERIAFAARLVGVLLGALLIVAVFLIVRARAGNAAALIAALLTAFLPDVLAHSGVTYNDVPLALAVLVACWSLDRFARAPDTRSAVIAALTTGMAIGVKFSALALGPIALAFIALEAATGRWRDAAWRRAIVTRGLLVLPLMYLLLVVFYLGDFTLAEFRDGFALNIYHIDAGHGGASAVLLGRQSPTGWWYYFPVAFFLKTSAALHILLLLAAAGWWTASRANAVQESGDATSDWRARWRSLVASPYRLEVVSVAVFLAFLMTANLNIGFRHALPLLPFVCMLAAVGIVRFVRTHGRAASGAVAVLLAWHVAAPLAVYPFYLSYLSEYTGDVEKSYDVLADSSLDWGQGLIALREFMDENDIRAVYLGYFGSALPEGYGIDYVPMPSYAVLPQSRLAPGTPAPVFAVVSATHLAGGYFRENPYAGLREREPLAVIGRSLFLFHATYD
jgi:hypothetical protein